MKAVGKNVLVKVQTEETNRIVVPRKDRGEVISIGSKVELEELKTGSLIVFNDKASDELNVDGQKYYIVPSEEIRLILN